MTEKTKKQNGSVEVEATFIMPIAILSVVMLLYLSLFMLQKASLQAALETSLMYFKNISTDRFLVRSDTVTYTKDESGKIGAGNSYEASNPANPLIDLLSGINKSNEKAQIKQDFEKHFYSVAGQLLFHEGIEVKINKKYGIIADTYEAEASQTVRFPLDLSMIGIRREYDFHVSAKVTTVNNDHIINNMDFALDIVEDTKLGDLARKFAEKVSSIYGEIKKTLHMS